MQSKIDRIVQELNRCGADAVVLHAPQNRRYLTGLRTSAGVVAVTAQGEAVFAVDFRYITEARQVLRTTPMDCRETSQEEADHWIGAYLRDKGCEKVLIEDQYLSMARVEALKEWWGMELAGCSWMEKLRAVKTPEERKKIKISQEIAELSLRQTMEIIAPGKTERQIEAYLTWRLLENGSENGAFGIVAASGPNAALPHATPTGRKLRRGDFLLIDFGAIYEGWYSDISRTFAIGCAGEDMRRIYQLVRQAGDTAIAAMADGVSAAAVDEAARCVIRQGGYGAYFGHGLGHGVGLDIHEKPRLRPESKDVLRAGNIVTVEPGIYLPDRFGVRIEDILAVTEDGCVDLTSMERDLVVL